MSGPSNRSLVPALRRLLHPVPPPLPVERCDLCGAALPASHMHLVDLQTRRLLCACETCRMMGSQTGGGTRRYVAPPARFERLPIAMQDTYWQALAVPVGLAFFFVNSGLGRVVAFYPGPAGAAESLPPMAAWSTLVSAFPVIGQLVPDVEALLVRRLHDEYACFVVPIDVCYELVGRIRARWTGFNGGDRVQADIDGFFETLCERWRP